MIIENRVNVKGNIKTTVTFKNEKYTRVQKNKFNGLEENFVVEWRKLKTNHLLNAAKKAFFEEKFKAVDTTTTPRKTFLDTTKGAQFLPASASTQLFDFKTTNPGTFDAISKGTKVEIDKQIREYIKAGALLGAVKYYKDMTGLGLKESKDYVDGLNAIVIAEKKWEQGMIPTQEQKALDGIDKFFKNSSINKKDFIAQTLKFHNEHSAGGLQTVKKIKDTMQWGLYESKLFFDTYIK